MMNKTQSAKRKAQSQKPKTKKEVTNKKTPVVPVADIEQPAVNNLGLRTKPPVASLAFGGDLELKTGNEKEGKEKVDKSLLKSSKEPQTMEELLTQTGYKLRVLKRGDFVEGTVNYLGQKTILIDVGGKTEGVLHEKEWDLVVDLIKTLKVGDKVTCYVVLPENDKGQVVLSLKRAGFEYKWKKMRDSEKTGGVVQVRGREVNKGGLICETNEGLMGFLPSSQMESSHYGKAFELINRFIQVKIIEVDPKQNRLIFSEKQVVGLEKQAAIEESLRKIKIGEIYEGKVTGIVPFGVFVDVSGLSGLVHISEIAWEKVENPGKYFKIGDKVKVMVLGIDEKTAKLNLSVKQLTPDPWQEVAKRYSLNQTVKGKVSRISSFGVFVNLEPGVEGLIHISKIPPEKELAEGENIECTIESIDAKKRRISLALIIKEKPIGYK